MFVKYKQRNACSVLKANPAPLYSFPASQQAIKYSVTALSTAQNL